MTEIESSNFLYTINITIGSDNQTAKFIVDNTGSTTVAFSPDITYIGAVEVDEFYVPTNSSYNDYIVDSKYHAACDIMSVFGTLMTDRICLGGKICYLTQLVKPISIV
jgi:hypothetical protein